MGVNSLPKTVTRQGRSCYLNPGPATAPVSGTLTTRLPSHPSGMVRAYSLDGLCVYMSLYGGRGGGYSRTPRYFRTDAIRTEIREIPLEVDVLRLQFFKT